jgi:penicillin-binding protein 1A
MQKIAEKAVSEGLLALDKRQGYRGPEGNLSESEISPFLEEIDRQLLNSSIVEGNEYLGVITKLAEESAKVMVGRRVGRLSLKDMKWARKPDLQVAYNTVRIEKPAEVLRVGDVVRVRLKTSSTLPSNRSQMPRGPLSVWT